ncbi:MAG: hypothetical protein Kow0037_27560 [Calditrichia bacterium]
MSEKQQPLKILYLEDMETDVYLLKRELRHYDQPYEILIIRSEQELLEALDRHWPDIVLSDYMLPGFDGMEALRIVREKDPDLPFILVTGSMNEMTAVSCMKAGAWDYVLKEKLNLLLPAIESALKRRVLIEEKKMAINQMLASERRYRTLIEAAPMGVVLHRQGKILFANQLAVKMAGLRHAADMIERSIYDFMTDEERQRIEKSLHGSEDGAVSSVVEMTFLTQQKKQLIAEVTTIPVEIGGEKALMSMINDISSRKQALEQYRQLVEQSNDAIYLLYEGRFELINRRFTEMFGYTLEDLNKPDFNFLELVAPESRDLLLQRQEAVKRGEKVPDIYEFTAITKSGEKLICEASVSYVQYKSGMATQGVLRNITERKQAERKLNQLSQAIEQSPIGVLITDGAGVVEYANMASEKITGYKREEILEKPFNLFNSESQNREILKEAWDQALSGSIWNGELKCLNKELEAYWGEFVFSPIYDSSGKISNVLVMIEDVTERKNLGEQFRQAQKMEAVGRLAGGVAHDFNNLLTVINGYCELILSSLDRQSPLFEQIHQIHRAGERAASLTSQLLAFSRKQVLNPRVIDLNKLIRDMEKMLQRLIGEDIDLTTFYDKTLPKIKADPGQVEQVLLNLIVNARDAMPEGGKLSIETYPKRVTKSYTLNHSEAREGYYAVVSVTDSGIGMDAETQRKIFEPFFTTKERGKGTGLGLSTVYGIVKQSGGFLTVYSEPGVGTSFKIYFPSYHEAESEESNGELAKEELSGTEKILVVEDEEAVRRLTIRGLSQFGYQLFEADNLEAALAVAETIPEGPDLLLTDVIMPGGSGKELAEAFRQRYPDTKIMFMSGYTDESIQRIGVLDDVSNFIHKPFTIEELAEKLRKMLDG